MRYDKLVRDKIPEIIESKGEACQYHIAGKTEYETKLLQKLTEEAQELQQNTSEEELADLLEVVDAIIVQKNFDRENIEKIKQEKAAKRGRFEKHIIFRRIIKKIAERRF